MSMARINPQGTILFSILRNEVSEILEVYSISFGKHIKKTGPEAEYGDSPLISRPSILFRSGLLFSSSYTRLGRLAVPLQLPGESKVGVYNVSLRSRTSRLEGFRSRWTTFFSCRYARPAGRSRHQLRTASFGIRRNLSLKRSSNVASMNGDVKILNSLRQVNAPTKDTVWGGDTTCRDSTSLSIRFASSFASRPPRRYVILRAG